VDESELQRLSEMTKFTVKLNTPAVSNIPADASIVIREVNSRTISGLGVVNDIEGNPALILRIDEPRRIYQQGQMTLIILIISLAVVGVIFAVVMLFPLENMLLRRLTQLHRNVQQAGTPGSSRACLDETGNDELSSLAVEINRMMSALEKTEKELRVSERRNILDAIPDILLVITASGTILEVKSDQDFFLDIPVEELNGRNIRDLGFSEEIIGQIDTAMRQALATEKVQTFELDIRLAKEYHYEFRMVALTGDEILVIGRDITERKRAEALLVERNTALQTSQKALKASAEALRISEERYALAMQGANDGLWDWDLKANRIYYSPRWKTMLGLAGDDIKPIPREWLSRVHPEDVDGVRRGLSNHLRGLTSHFESEYRILHKDGTYRWVLSRGIAVWEKPVKETSPDGVTVRGNGKTRKEDSSFNKGIENALRIAGSQTDISRTENWRSSSCCTMPSMTP